MRRITLPTTAARNHAGPGATFPSLLSPPPPPPPAATLPLSRLHRFHRRRDGCHGWGIWASVPGTRRRLCWSSSPLPPPEWINPFLDLSDLATAPPASDRAANPSPWLARVVALLSGSHAVDADLDAYCRRFLIRLSPAFVSHALRSPELRARPGTALRFFRWAARQRHYPQHQLESYVTLVDILASPSPPLADHHRVARELVAELRELGFRLTPPACGSLIKSLGAAGMVEELLSVWRWMKESGIEPSVFTYNCLLCGLVNASFLDSAQKVFDVMRSDKNPGIDPDVVTYNIMIKGYCGAGKTKLAVDKLREMEAAPANQGSTGGGCGGGGRGRGLAPDKITYTMLIQAHYADGDFDACLGLYHEMVETGLDVPSHAYTLVITGLCRAGKPFQALAVFEGMVGRGCCRGNAAVYTALMDAFAKSGNGERAMGLLEKMKREGVEPDEVTYGVVVNFLCKSGRPEEALHWFRLCRDRGVAVNAVFYCSLIDGFGKAGKAEEARRLFEEMTAAEGLVPDAFCYNALMDALCRAGRTDEALTLWERMKRPEGVDGTVHTYTILMRGLFEERRNEEAMGVWESMVDAGITPTAAAFRVLARGLCLSGKVGRACRVLDELGPMGVVPEGAHEEMIQVLCGAGRIGQACKLADGIVERGREIPGRVRTAFINALRKAGKPELAIKMVNSKMGIGYDRLQGGIKRRVKFQTLLLS